MNLQLITLEGMLYQQEHACKMSVNDTAGSAACRHEQTQYKTSLQAAIRCFEGVNTVRAQTYTALNCETN